MVAFLDYLPRGNTLSDASWQRRHHFLQGLLLAHLVGLLLFGIARGQELNEILEALAMPAAGLLLSRLLRTRRLSSLSVTAGLGACSAALVVLADGAIEAHFHFFVMISFIALYQDWVPFLWNVVFTVLSHGVGSAFIPGLIFNHQSGQTHPWAWSLVHGVAVLAACVGVIVFWRTTEDEQARSTALRGQLVESNKRRFTADLLVNLARRNQNLIYRQLDLLNRLEEHERDAEQLSHLFQLDHLATRIRRNAESLLVLSGEEPARKWGRAVLLVDVVRAAIAEIEELDRVDFAVDESLAVSGRAVADCTHLLAELVENAVHFSPPGLSVMIRTRAYLPAPGAQVLTVEDWGVGMSQTDLAEANDILRSPRDVDLASAQRLGLHVVARLAQRYSIDVSLEGTPGGGVTAVVVLPAALFVAGDDASSAPPRREPPTRRPLTTPLPAGALPGRSLPGGPAGSGGPVANGAAPHGGGPNGSSAAVLDREPTVDDTRPGDAGSWDPDPSAAPPAIERRVPRAPQPPRTQPRADAPPTAPEAKVAPDTAPRAAAAGTAPLEWPGVADLPNRLPAPRTDPPAAAAAAAPAEAAPAGAEETRTDWSSWWSLAGKDGRTRPDPLSDPIEDLTELGALGDLPARTPAAAQPAPAPDLSGLEGIAALARRTPQASLASELRRSREEAARVPEPAPARDAQRASSALSRFQANQRAARQAADPVDRR